MISRKRAVKKRDIETVAVIGSGFSGLVSSLLLARAGIKVTLLERAEQVAPLLRNYNKEGFEVNHGFHYLGGYYPDSALDKCFEDLGIREKLTPVSLNDDGNDMFTGLFDTDLVVPVGIESVKAEFEKNFPLSSVALAEYFKLLDKVIQEFSFFDIEGYFYRATPSLTDISLFQFLKAQNAEEKLINFLDAYSQMLMGLSAHEISVLSHLLGVGAYFYSTQTFEGGGGALIDAVEAEVRKAGVEIIVGCEVVQVHSAARRQFSGLRVRMLNTGEESDLTLDACISTMHPKRLLPLLQEGSAATIYSRRIADYSETRAVALFHLAVDKDASKDLVRNYHRFKPSESGEMEHLITLLPDYTGCTGASSQERIMTTMMTAWLNDSECPERMDGACRCAQFLPESKFGPVETRYLSELSAKMCTRLETAFPQLKGKYRIINAVSPCHFDRLNATWDGSIYGVKCSVNRLGMSTISPVKGLLLAGQSITAPGIFGTLVSAYLACNRITGNSKL